MAECHRPAVGGVKHGFRCRERKTNDNRLEWYERRFGHPIQAYGSAEEAINHWPTTSTCVGVTIRDAQFSVYEPYGLNDLF